MENLGISVLFIGNNFTRLMGGLYLTLYISLISVFLSIIFGTIFGMFMSIKNPLTRFISRIYLDFIRIMPQLVLLFIMYFWVSHAFGVDISNITSAIIVFTLWGSAEMGDLVRSAIISIPKHQYESSYALGFSKMQIYRYIILPQTLRTLLPLTINLITRMIKTTSLVALIGVVEMLKIAQQIIDANRFNYPDAALWIYGVIFILYFLMCYPISFISKKLEIKWRVR